jgi:hypothetical protein
MFDRDDMIAKLYCAQPSFAPSLEHLTTLSVLNRARCLGHYEMCRFVTVGLNRVLEFAAGGHHTFGPENVVLSHGTETFSCVVLLFDRFV